MAMTRINGHDLGHNIGSEVILLGRINNVGSNGRSIELITTDSVVINVTLPEPLDESPEGYIEVKGIPQSKSSLSCQSYIHFPPELSDDFEMTQYSELLTILNILGPKKWKISECY